MLSVFKRRQHPSAELSPRESLQGYVEAANSGNLQTYKQLDAAMKLYNVYSSLAVFIIRSGKNDDRAARHRASGFGHSVALDSSPTHQIRAYNHISPVGGYVELASYKYNVIQESTTLFREFNGGSGSSDHASNEDRIFVPHYVSPEGLAWLGRLTEQPTDAWEKFSGKPWDPAHPLDETACIEGFVGITSHLIDQFVQLSTEVN